MPSDTCFCAQVLQRPGPFNLRDMSLALQKLPATATSGSCEPAKTGEGKASMFGKWTI